MRFFVLQNPRIGGDDLYGLCFLSQPARASVEAAAALSEDERRRELQRMWRKSAALIIFTLRRRVAGRAGGLPEDLTGRISQWVDYVLYGPAYPLVPDR
eukprot:gene13511-24870_t